LSVSRTYQQVGMALGLSVRLTSIGRERLFVTYVKYLNQFIRTMNRYHICYLIGKDLCTGITLEAYDYGDALKKFNSNNEILYICLMR